MLRDPEWWKEHGDATLPKQFSEWVDATITIAHNEKVPPILKEKYGSDEDLMYALGILYKGVAMIAVLQAIREDNWDKLEAFKQMKPTEDFDLDEWLNKL
jgi:hypothetical protein